MVLIRSLAWEPPYAMGAAQEKTKRQKKEKKKKEKKEFALHVCREWVSRVVDIGLRRPNFVRVQNMMSKTQA